MFSLKYLKLFSLHECSLLFFGEKMDWTYEYLKKAIFFTQGYLNDTEFIDMFIRVVLSFKQEEQENLLMFVTGQRRVDVALCLCIHCSYKRG